MKFSVIVPILFSLNCLAHEGGPLNLNSQNTMIKKSIRLPNDRGIVHFIVRNDGEAMGRNFLIEVRAQCTSTPALIEEVPVATVKSTCRVDKKSYKYDQTKQTIRVLIFEPDSVSYNLQTQKDPLKAKLTCLDKAVPYLVDMTKFCVP